jgi:hypothetical protein
MALKVHADPVEGKKSHVRRNTKHHEGRGKLKAKRHGDKVHQFKHNAPEKFAKKPKDPLPDNVGRKVRPAAHNPRQTKVANRAKNLVKKLSGHII